MTVGVTVRVAVAVLVCVADGVGDSGKAAVADGVAVSDAIVAVDEGLAPSVAVRVGVRVSIEAPESGVGVAVSRGGVAVGLG